MSPTDVPLAGEELLDAVTDAMVLLHDRYYHRKPATASTRLLEGDLLACVLGGVYTEVEKTMIELERAHQVRDIRSTFQRATARQFIEVVERLSGRRVVDFVSTSHVGPDLEVELFFLDVTGSATDPTTRS